ncbi:MAG: carbohydrate ABC transporter permease [Cellulomonadaceae bacterium]|jgi:multiple sugar transport system permease protein|nr:carbohydrate ABC transporter permease [Cellulomonadaceae bacterium]
MKSKKLSPGKVLVYLLLIVGSVFMIGPFIWSVLTSFKTLTESVQMPPQFLPSSWALTNYIDVWNALPFLAFFRNTFLMILGRVVISTILCALAGYSFARIKFKGSGILFTILLIPMMVPGQIYLLPQFMIVARLGWLNTVIALIVPGMASVVGTFFMRQFFKTVPAEIEEAAELDGCSVPQTFFRVVLPLAKTPLTTLAIFTTLFAWGDLMWPLIVNTRQDQMTLSAGLAFLQGQFTTNFPQLMAGSVIATIPIIIAFLFFQRAFIQGIAQTGGK